MKRKKLSNSVFVLAFILFNLSAALKAQDNEGFKAGLVAGINASQISGDNLGGFYKPSFIVGGFVRRKIKSNALLQFDIMYIGKGSRKNANFELEDYTIYRLNMHYIEVPLAYIWKYREKLWFEGGLSAAALLTYYEGDENGDLSAQQPEKFKPYDFSYFAGIHLNFNTKWSLNLRFSNSILPVRENFGGATFRLNRGQYHSCINTRLVYLF